MKRMIEVRGRARIDACRYPSGMVSTRTRRAFLQGGVQSMPALPPVDTYQYGQRVTIPAFRCGTGTKKGFGLLAGI